MSNKNNRRNRQRRANAAKRSQHARTTVSKDVVKEELTVSTELMEEAGSESNVVILEERRTVKLSIVEDSETASNDGASGSDDQPGIDRHENSKPALTAVSNTTESAEVESGEVLEPGFIDSLIDEANEDFNRVSFSDDFDLGDSDSIGEDEDADEDEVRDRASSSDGYFDDDEAVLAGDDKILHEDEDLTIISQGENIVTCEIVNLYKDNGKLKGKYSIRADPPIFQIEDNSGSYASFVVTQELARTLERNFGDIRKVYSGLDPSVKMNPLSQESLRKKYSNLTEWISENKIKSGLIVLVILLLVVSQAL